MASKTIVTCDVCGKDPATTTSVTIAGASFDVDLCERHTKALSSAVEPFVNAGRRAGGASGARRRATKKTAAKKTAAKKAAATKTAAKRTGARTTKTGAKRAAKKTAAKKSAKRAGTPRAPRSRKSTDVAEIRAWAQASGLTVADRGRLRPAVIAAFREANAPGRKAS